MTTSKVVSAVPTSAQKGFKLVIALQDGKLVETVAIVHEGVSRSTGTLQGRVTVCVSSQVGCKMGCTFCATGTLGWIGDLSAGEIVEQVWHVERRAPDFGVHWRVTNVTFMGMGGADGALNPPKPFAHAHARTRARLRRRAAGQAAAAVRRVHGREDVVVHRRRAGAGAGPNATKRGGGERRR